MPRPKLPRRKISVSVTIEEATKKTARKLGEGNLSKGIEIAVKRAFECESELKELKAKMADKMLT
jgi:hypothetical protein